VSTQHAIVPFPIPRDEHALVLSTGRNCGRAPILFAYDCLCGVWAVRARNETFETFYKSCARDHFPYELHPKTIAVLRCHQGSKSLLVWRQHTRFSVRR
jgi:hypothetical protein